MIHHEETRIMDIDATDGRLVHEHSMLLESNENYFGGGVLYVDTIDDHEHHIFEHERFLREHGKDMRIHDRAFLRAHIDLHRIVSSEKNKIERKQSFLEAEQTLAELFS